MLFPVVVSRFQRKRPPPLIAGLAVCLSLHARRAAVQTKAVFPPRLFRLFPLSLSAVPPGFQGALHTPKRPVIQVGIPAADAYAHCLALGIQTVLALTDLFFLCFRSRAETLPVLGPFVVALPAQGFSVQSVPLPAVDTDTVLLVPFSTSFVSVLHHSSFRANGQVSVGTYRVRTTAVSVAFFGAGRGTVGRPYSSTHGRTRVAHVNGAAMPFLRRAA